jgi:hypothetical protein
MVDTQSGPALEAFLIIKIKKKKDEAWKINDFRPISLVGGVYKILSKVLTNRLKLILGKIVSSSFFFNK